MAREGRRARVSCVCAPRGWARTRSASVRRRSGLKVLLDSCIWPGAKDRIANAGHDVEWVGDWDADPGDADILARALANRQVIVTLDKDFGELAIAFGRAQAGIVRLVDVRHMDQAALCPGGHPNSPSCGRPKFPHLEDAKRRLNPDACASARPALENANPNCERLCSPTRQRSAHGSAFIRCRAMATRLPRENSARVIFPVQPRARPSAPATERIRGCCACRGGSRPRPACRRKRGSAHARRPGSGS